MNFTWPPNSDSGCGCVPPIDPVYLECRFCDRVVLACSRVESHLRRGSWKVWEHEWVNHLDRLLALHGLNEATT